MSNPKVFISYSHSSDEYKEKIRDFAVMLRSHGIDATIDEWEVAGGNDLNAFMEKSIREADKVIIACDKSYVEKANSRTGGAGIETYIISPEVYKKHDQNKYIPVIFEKDVNGNPYIPDYMKSRLYYDFTGLNFQHSEELLIRDVFGKPKHTKPPMGIVPNYIEEYDKDDPKSYLNSIYALVRIANSQIANTSNTSLIRKFTNEISNIYEDNLITYKEYNDDPVNLTFSKIELFESIIVPYSTILESEIITEKITSSDLIFMFEQLVAFDKKLKKNDSISTNGMWDHINFSIYELFLYTVTILRINEKHQIISELLHANFFGLYRFNDKKYSDFVGFNKHLQSLEIRKTALKLNRISLHADLIVDRAEKTKYKAASIIKTDLYLAFYSEIKNSYNSLGFWFPRLQIYESMFNYGEIFEKMISKRYLKGFLIEIGMKDLSELESRLKQYSEDYEKNGKYNRGYTYAFGSVPLLTEVLKVSELGKVE